VTRVQGTDVGFHDCWLESCLSTAPALTLVPV
jgi:hypothetical protein